MVEFIKSKTSAYVNKPVGVISTNTGATDVGNSIAKLGAGIQERAFRDAVEEQEKVGKDTVMKLSVVDENNQLVMAELPTNLSQVARNVAEPLLRKKMGTAIYNDTQAGLADIRKTAKNEQEFKQKADVYLGQVEFRMIETGGEGYVDQFRNTFSKIYGQHANDLKIKDGLRENEYHLTNHVKNIETRIANIKTLYQSGDPNAYSEFETTLNDIRNTPDMFMNVKQSGVNNLLDALSVAKTHGIIKGKIADATSNDIVNIQNAITDGGLSINKVPDQYKNVVKMAIDKEAGVDPNLRKKLSDALQVDKTNRDQLEQDARIETNRLKPIRAYKASQQIQTFNNKLISRLGDAKNINEITTIINEASNQLKSNASRITTIGLSAVQQNEKSIYQSITDGIVNNLTTVIPDMNSYDINAVRQAILSNGKRMSGLRAELVEPIKTILKATPDQFNAKLAQSLSQMNALVKASEINAKNEQEAVNLKSDIEQSTALPNTKTNKTVESMILNGRDESYFYSQESLGDGEIEKYIAKKGYLPPTIVNQMNQLAQGQLTDEQQAVALNRFARFARYLNPETNNIQNRMMIKGGISKETNSLLMAALDVTQIKGVDNFNDVLTTISLAKEDSVKFNNKVSMILNDGKQGGVQRYLQSNSDVGGNYNIVNEMKPYVEYLVASGMNDKGAIDELVTQFIDQKFLPTNGIVADPSGPVGKSMYALEAIFTDDGLADKFIELVNDQLPDGYSLNDTIQRSSSNFLDSYAESQRFNPVQSFIAKGLSALSQVGTPDVKKVYLVPMPLSPTNIDRGYGGEVVYQAMELDPTGQLIPLIGKNSSGDDTMFAWSSKEVTNQIVKKELDSARVDVESRERDDMDSEALAQSALNQETIRKNNAPTFGQRLMNVD